jgi:hypothetical protein
MNEVGVVVQLDGGREVFWPGDRLAGRYRVVGVEPGDLKSVAVSVHWFTEGKGETDVGVHWQEERGEPAEPAADGCFATTLPPGPWSYDGLVVKVVWCVQVRATRRRGKPLEGLVYFWLGDTATATEASP